jgi:drug/metabolite transporter (DMT)-like permease
MIAILGGLGAAACWTMTTLCLLRASRLVGPFSVLAWVTIVGLAVTAPIAAFGGTPSNLDSSIGAWLLLSGVCNVGGLLFAYQALRVGKVGLASPIISTEGAIAAIFAVIAGEALGAPRAFALVAIVVGIIAVAGGAAGEEAPGTNDKKAVLFATAAALSFGLGLYSTGRVSGDVPLAWAVLPPRVIGVAAVAIPLILLSRLQLTRRAAPFLVASGLAEVGGYFSFALGTRHGIAVTSVLGSQFAVTSALAAFLLFGEKLGRIRIAGVIVTAIGVAVLSALQA